MAATDLQTILDVLARLRGTPRCLECGYPVVIGEESADCPSCEASWPVVGLDASKETQV